MAKRISQTARQHIHLLVGAFLGVAAILFAMAAVMTLANKGVFTPTYPLYCVFKANNDSLVTSAVMGLSRGTSVQVNGVEVGKVDSVLLLQDGSVKLRLTILEKYQAHITANSVAYPVRDRNIISDRVLFISHGSGSRMLEAGETIIATSPRDLETLLDQTRILLNQVQFLVQAGDSLLRMAGNPKTTVGALIASDSLYRQLMTTLKNADEVGDQAQELAAKVSDAAPELIERTQKLQSEIQAVSRRSLVTLDKLDSLLVHSDSLAVQSRPLLKPAEQILRKGQVELDKSGELIDGVKSHWLLKSQFEKSSGIPHPSEIQE
jgi:phospholipid/cholesterol/gamma-HCH transport system substrate-binding protein